MIQTNQDVTDINAMQNVPQPNDEVLSMKDDKDDEDDTDDEDETDEDMDTDDEEGTGDDDTEYDILPSNDSGISNDDNAAVAGAPEEGE